MQKPNPITVRFDLPGEILERKEVFVTQSGEVLEYDVSRKILVPSKKNQRDIVTDKKSGRSYMIPSKQFVKWYRSHKEIFDQIYFNLFNEGEVRLPIVRCDIRMLFYYPDARTRDNHNKFETIVDMMREAGIISDDSFKIFNEQSIKGRMCRNRPRTEVYLTIIEADSKEYNWDVTDPKYYEVRKKRRALMNKITRHKRKQKRDQGAGGIPESPIPISR